MGLHIFFQLPKRRLRRYYAILYRVRKVRIKHECLDLLNKCLKHIEVLKF